MIYCIFFINLLQDNGPGNGLNSSTTLNILIDDADDLPAEFSPSSYEAEVPENAAKVRTELLDRCFDTNSKLYLLCTNSTLDKLKERSFFLISIIIITTTTTKKISQKKLMLTCLADIFRAPLSQSSARRANVNFFFSLIFFLFARRTSRESRGCFSALF